LSNFSFYLCHTYPIASTLAKRILVTGLGIITSIGNNLLENFHSLKAVHTGIGPVRLLETSHRGTLPAGEIPLTDAELATLAGVKPVDGLTRTALLGMIAAKEAVTRFQSSVVSQQSSVGISNPKPGTRNPKPGTRNFEPGTQNRWGLISGSTVGGMVATEKYYPDYLENDTRNAWIAGNDCSDSTERIAEFLGIDGFISTVNTACSSSANAIMTAARLIRSGVLDCAVAGGTDALSMFTLNGFNTLMIYDKEPCKPFDRDRNGLNLGEGAAYLVLESEDIIGGRAPLCELSGWGNSTDAFHQTALSPEGKGPYLAMKNAMEHSGLLPGQIGYINAHGTATINNDLSEGIAIQKLFGKRVPPVSSTKAFTGHLLGAAGATEAIYSILGIQHGIIWPNLNYRQKMDELDFEPVVKLTKGIEISHVLTNSFGFGGNNTSLIFSKI
jgi:3-oxoacyl-[acyl-carrier-protein] synthase-1